MRYRIIFYKMKSSALSILLGLFLLAFIFYEGIEVKKRLDTINGLIEERAKPHPKVKTVQEQPMNLEKECEKIYTATETCLKDAQSCLDVLGGFTTKNKKFEKEVGLCQTRNAKNSKRNNDLKDRLDAVQTRMNKFKQTQKKESIEL